MFRARLPIRIGVPEREEQLLFSFHTRVRFEGGYFNFAFSIAATIDFNLGDGASAAFLQAKIDAGASRGGSGWGLSATFSAGSTTKSLS